MSRLGFKSVVFHGDACLGELDIVPVKDQNFRFPNNEIRIHHISQYSERCPPISILQTISSFAVCCKLESTSTVEQAQLINLHASCFHERQTAVVLLGEEEVHLVAMPSKMKKFPCFWCYLVPSGLYNSCLRMLNLRCLSMVFDLDETLIVANTMKSFEDRIEALQGWIAREMDSVRVSGMSAELKRYVEDRALLKQYAESDCVVDSGKVYKTLLEEVPPVCAGRERVVRPVIRLPEKNIVLTRITPEIRDTSVLVRLRPAWEDLRSYLTAKGRKRFEVYVCTMAERDYALEIWRLLDPEAHLISSELLLDRVVCVKSGARKSLLNVFPHGICHPKMAMVIDDRLKVWEDKDQPRVHVVPAFTPYYAPQAETANAVPVLCVARNVACNVRGGFFKEFDENLLRRISQLFYEDDVVNLPSAPDVSNYLMSEDASFQSNGNANAAIAEGMNGPEVAQRLNYMDERKVADSATLPTPNGPKLRPDISQLPLVPSLNIFGPSLRPALMSEKPSLLGAPCRRDNSFPEFNPDMRRRFFMTNPSQDVRPYMSRLPAQPHKPVHPQGGWLVDEDSGGDLNGKRGMGNIEESDALRPDKQGVCQSTVGHGAPNSAPVGIPSHTSQMKSEERSAGNEALKQNLTSRNPISEAGMSQNQSSFSGRELQADGRKMNLLPSPLSIGVLQEIGRRCSSKIEFRSIASTSDDLQFSFEVLFTGEKIGVGIGKTRKDAQQQAAENALRSLADKYVSYVLPRSGAVHRDFDKLSFGNENGFLWDIVNPGSNELPVEDGAAAEVSELAPRSTGDNMVDQRGQKRANSPRLSESNPNKRTKEEVLSGYGPIYS